MLDDMRVPGCDFCGSKHHVWRDHDKPRADLAPKRPIAYTSVTGDDWVMTEPEATTDQGVYMRGPVAASGA